MSQTFHLAHLGYVLVRCADDYSRGRGSSEDNPSAEDDPVDEVGPLQTRRRELERLKVQVWGQADIKKPEASSFGEN